ncbi:MAG: hypothetical protein KF784_08195 [Fimbriimonadaceae bacterium]|nr:hypothetical protein [Fimbriimonadaceae bacterium]
MLRSFAILLLKLEFLAFLAAGVAFANVPFSALGFFGLIAIPDAWQSKSKGMRGWATIGLFGLLGWAAFTTWQSPEHALGTMSARGTKIALLGLGTLFVVLFVTLLVVAMTRPKKRS